MTDPRLIRAESLTPRQRQLIAFVVEGCTNREIATRLRLTEGTVKVHLHNIYRKTGVKNRTALSARFLGHLAA